MDLPSLVLHADWSVRSEKRVVARARLHGGTYVVEAPALAPPPASLLDELVNAAPGGVLAGFDVPMGLPAFYANVLRIDSFPAWLRSLPDDAWSAFARVAETPRDIGLDRPFYPARPGGARRHHLYDALDTGADGLLRVCERGRPRAAPLFWTLGGSQVGKAALHAWEHVVRPALRREDVHLWPFDTPLARPSGVVLAETWPSDVVRRFDLPLRKHGGKAKLAARRAVAPALLERAEGVVRVGDEARRAATDGFASDDAFDAFVGLVGMLEVLTGTHAAGGEGASPETLRVEGWILGRSGTGPFSS